MKKKIIINYICEVNYPNSSAYSIHVLKMCDAFAKNNKVNLFLPFSKVATEKLNKDYSIKRKITYLKIFDKTIKFNLINRICFSLKVLKKINEKKLNCSLLVSRSVIFAIIASLLKKNIILEAHHELSGLTKKIYNFLIFFGFLKNLKYIFIHKNLIPKFIKFRNNKYLCLDDAVDIVDYNFVKSKKLKTTCVYVGSFHLGKGLELILKIAKKLKNINFHIYGDKKFLKYSNIPKNVKIFDYIKYNKIPLTLSKYHIALMPYGNFVSGRLSNINLVKSMSPLKMFDYLASGNIILASNLKIYKHILIHKKNSILISNSKLDLWSEWIDKIFKNNQKFNYLKKNAILTSVNNTWLIRSKKILDFAKKNFSLDV